MRRLAVTLAAFSAAALSAVTNAQDGGGCTDFMTMQANYMALVGAPLYRSAPAALRLLQPPAPDCLLTPRACCRPQVMDECCDEPGEDCSAGFPATCACPPPPLN